jgi:hypothetical protein
MATPAEAVAKYNELIDLPDEESQARAQRILERLNEAGFGDLIDTASKPAAPAQAPAQEEPSFLDNWGRPIAETGGALIGGAMGIPGGLPGMMLGAGLGGEGAGIAYDYLAGNEQRGPMETVQGALFNAMGGPTAPLKKAPAFLQGLVPEGQLFDYGNKGVAAAADELSSIPSRTEEEVRRRGGTLTAGQKGSTLGAKTEAALEATPFGSGDIHRQRDTTRGIFGEMLEEATPLAGSRDVVGDAASQAYQRNLDWGTARVEDAYRTLDDIMAGAGGDQRISMNSLTRLMHEYDALVQQDPGFAELVFQDPDLYRSIEAMRGMVESGQTPTYDTIKQLRTLVGKKVGDAFYQTGEKQGLRNLYRALTEDLDEGAFEIAGEAALSARKNADTMNAQLMSDIKRVDPIFGNLDNPTAVYKKIATTLVNDPRLAKDVKQAIGENQWNRFVDSWINMAAMPTPGNASMVGDVSENTLMTTLNRLKQQSPEGYKLLVEGREPALDVIQELATSLQRGDRFFNRSNTANALGTQQLAQSGLLFGTAGTAGLLTGGPNTGLVLGTGLAAGNALFQKILAKALTSPRFSKALEAVGSKYADRLPIGADLMRALLAAGADQKEVEEIFNGTE